MENLFDLLEVATGINKRKTKNAFGALLVLGLFIPGIHQWIANQAMAKMKTQSDLAEKTARQAMSRMPMFAVPTAVPAPTVYTGQTRHNLPLR